MKYIPVGINDWNLALVIPSDVIDAKAQAIIKKHQLYSGVMILLIFIHSNTHFLLKTPGATERCRGLTKNIESIYRTVPSSVVQF